MGAEALGTAPREDISFTDRKVCREYLCGLCPHTLFT
jgi:RNA-binding protein Luc7-like 2